MQGELSTTAKSDCLPSWCGPCIQIKILICSLSASLLQRVIIANRQSSRYMVQHDANDVER